MPTVYVSTDYQSGGEHCITHSFLLKQVGLVLKYFFFFYVFSVLASVDRGNMTCSADSTCLHISWINAGLSGLPGYIENRKTNQWLEGACDCI